MSQHPVSTVPRIHAVRVPCIPDKTMIGEKISPVLVEIEEALFDSEQSGLPPMYTDDGFRAALKVFMSAMLDRMWMLQGKEAMDFNDRSLMAEKMGGELRVFVKTYTDIDTTKLYRP